MSFRLRMILLMTLMLKIHHSSARNLITISILNIKHWGNKEFVDISDFMLTRIPGMGVTEGLSFTFRTVQDWPCDIMTYTDLRVMSNGKVSETPIPLSNSTFAELPTVGNTALAKAYSEMLTCIQPFPACPLIANTTIVGDNCRIVTDLTSLMPMEKMNITFNAFTSDLSAKIFEISLAVQTDDYANDRLKRPTKAQRDARTGRHTRRRPDSP